MRKLILMALIRAVFLLVLCRNPFAHGFMYVNVAKCYNSVTYAAYATAVYAIIPNPIQIWNSSTRKGEPRPFIRS